MFLMLVICVSLLLPSNADQDYDIRQTDGLRIGNINTPQFCMQDLGITNCHDGLSNQRWQLITVKDNWGKYGQLQNKYNGQCLGLRPCTGWPLTCHDFYPKFYNCIGSTSIPSIGDIINLATNPTGVFAMLTGSSPLLTFGLWKIKEVHEYHDFGNHKIFLLQNILAEQRCLYYSPRGEYQTTGYCGDYRDSWWYAAKNGQFGGPGRSGANYRSDVDIPIPPEYYYLGAVVSFLLVINICLCFKFYIYDKCKFKVNHKYKEVQTISDSDV
eukprot:306818_1